MPTYRDKTEQGITEEAEQVDKDRRAANPPPPTSQIYRLDLREIMATK
jgi:hypothetical protein